MSDKEAIELAQEDQAALRPWEVDSGKVIAAIQGVVTALDGAIKISLQRCNASDFVKMGDKYYLQASACQKIRSVWGIYFRDKTVVREEFQDGQYGYYVTGMVGSAVLDRLYGKEVTIEADGGRSSTDPFFCGKDGKKYVDPMDVRKAAVSNFEARAISNFLGLKNFTDADLKRNGINLDQVAKVEYQKGAEGGGNATVISDAQRKRLFAISKEVGMHEDVLKAHLKLQYNIDTTSKILRKDYEAICAWVQKGGDTEIQVEDRDA